MRILQLSSARHFGGGERHFVDLTKGLISKGHEVSVALARDSPLLSELQTPGSNLLRLAFLKPFDVATAWKLRRFARQQEVEIVHAHMARDYPLAALAAGKVGLPRLVLTRHVLFPMGNLHKLTRRRVARVIAVSAAVAASLRAQAIFKDAQITIVRNGIDCGRFLGALRKSQTDLRRVGMLGELSPVKGQIDFVRAAAIIATQRDDAEFVIAGRDNSAGEKHSRELKQVIESSGLTERVRLIESTIDVTEFLSRLDVFVSASHSEAFGIAIVEAMASGVPVIATATAGAREIISDGLTGRLVPIGDAAELAKGISDLLNDSQQREDLSANARKAVTERFSLERMIAETENVYRDVLRG